MNLPLIKGQVCVPLTVESSWLYWSRISEVSVRLDDAGEEFTFIGSVLRYGKPMGRILL